MYVYHTRAHKWSHTLHRHTLCHSCICANSIKWFLNSNKEVFILLGRASDSLYFPPPYHNSHTHSHRSSQTGFPHWIYATAAGANQTPRCPNIPDIPALFQAHKFNLWTHLLACQWPERGIIDSIHLTQVQWALGLANRTAITTLALPDSRKTYVNWLITPFLVSGSLHAGHTAKCENMRKVKRRD